MGVAAGKAEAPGDVQVWYQFQRIEQDAVFSPFSQDDFLLSTNHSSHAFGVRYVPWHKAELHVWTLISSPLDGVPGTMLDTGDWSTRIRADLTFAF